MTGIQILMVINMVLIAVIAVLGVLCAYEDYLDRNGRDK